MTNHETFLQAIYEKRIVQVQFNSKEKGLIQRFCVPFDFGPWRRNVIPNPNRYHFYDLDSPEGEHNLSVTPDQIVIIKMTENNFNPADYVTWAPPYNWFIARDWGRYS